MLADHVASGAGCTVGCIEVPRDEASAFGVMAVDEERKIIEFVEKPFKENELCALVERMLTKARIDFAQADQRKSTQSLLGKLTGRERQVLERIVAGRLNKQIADDLSISIKTVEAHRANIMEKLNVNTVADLLRLALS